MKYILWTYDYGFGERNLAINIEPDKFCQIVDRYDNIWLFDDFVSGGKFFYEMLEDDNLNFIMVKK